MKLQQLRKKYPRFVFEKYSYRISGKNLEVFFDFKIEPDISFRPKIVIKNIQGKVNNLENLIFHLGLMEIPTYWKTTCSPEIIIRAGFLNREQISWWKGLIIKGMGQFFFENKIDWRSKNFLKIKCESNNKYKIFNGKLKNRYLVPFSGGRDSIVTIELLKKKLKTALFLVNPNKQIKKAAKVTNIKKQIIVQRVIDKKLLALNKKGYLNGHTPFTALLSFLSVFCAVLFDCKNIVFSNEKSANEGNVKYLDRMINHQWAKSSEFEIMFKKYCKKYLARNINYSSFLRKYTELEISKKLINFPQYFPVFSSCNSSMRMNAKQVRWCGNCPKCLFVYLTFYPFLNKKQLLLIFGRDVFQNKKLLPIMKALMGQGRTKPFECVGTRKESLDALKLSLEKAGENKVPYLLTKAKKMVY
ncbi:MAG TPA: hypothetical protein VJ378_00565 [Candidatus Paceibacterota bacterium]|nr:hypothetical protein [Candidatus Paceibacterota bacterium]